MSYVLSNFYSHSLIIFKINIYQILISQPKIGNVWYLINRKNLMIRKQQGRLIYFEVYSWLINDENVNS